MYLYIYDTFLNQDKYTKTLKRLETDITRLGLSGLISRFDTAQKKIDIEDEIKKGLKTLVVVGDDVTVNEILRILVNLKPLNVPINNLTFGIIPIGKNNYLAKNLSIIKTYSAPEVIAQRMTKKLDLGLVNQGNSSSLIPFLASAFFKSNGTTITIDDQYSLDVLSNYDVNILNLNISNLGKEKSNKLNISSNDGKLELVIKEKKDGFFSKNRKTQDTVVHFKQAVISDSSNELILDGFYRIEAPLEISVAKQKFNFIIGKNRII